MFELQFASNLAGLDRYRCKAWKKCGVFLGSVTQIPIYKLAKPHCGFNKNYKKANWDNYTRPFLKKKIEMVIHNLEKWGGFLFERQLRSYTRQ